MDFVKLFEDFHIKYTTRVNRGWVNVDCPYCTSEHPMHLGFNPVEDYCTCWNCGGHNLKQTLSILLSVSRKELNEILENYEGKNSLLYQIQKNKVPKATQLELPSSGFTTAERKYLLSRDFSPRFLHEKYGVSGGGISGDWKYRILIPLYFNHKLVSWTGRSILSKEKINELNIPRYKNLSIEKSVINPKHALFNIDNCFGKTIALVEGAFDVMRLGDNFICSFGTELTQEQVSVISSRFEKVFIIFDSEEKAQAKGRKFGMQLSSIGVDVELVDCYSDFGKNDGAELSEDEVKIIRNELGL